MCRGSATQRDSRRNRLVRWVLGPDMEPATGLAAIAAAARSRGGHEPWIFYPREGRWRWWSFERGWTEIERWRAVLERGEGPAADVAPPPESSPEALCRYLAVSAAESGDEYGEAFAAFDRLLAGGAPALLAGGAPAREIVVVAPPENAAADAPAVAQGGRKGAATPPETEPGALASSPVAAAGGLRDAAAPTERLARLWLEWCCANLAVLALEPKRRAMIGSVLWCRPTAVLLDAGQERALAAAVAERSGGRDRRAAALLDRLRVLVVAAETGDEADEVPPPAADWGAWGVERRPLGELEVEGPGAAGGPGRGVR